MEASMLKGVSHQLHCYQCYLQLRSMFNLIGVGCYSMGSGRRATCYLRGNFRTPRKQLTKVTTMTSTDNNPDTPPEGAGANVPGGNNPVVPPEGAGVIPPGGNNPDYQGNRVNQENQG